MEIIVFWLLFAIVVGIAAGARGRSGVGWFLLAVLISPLLGLILVLVLPNLRLEKILTAQRAPANAPLSRPCPYCAEPIQKDAVVCKHCRRDVPKGTGPRFAEEYKGYPFQVQKDGSVIVETAQGDVTYRNWKEFAQAVGS